MSRQLTALLLAVTVLCAAAPVSAYAAPGAASRIIEQKSANKGSFGVYLRHSLMSGHHYRVEIVAPTNAKVTGNGFENYAYILNHRLLQGMKPFLISGKTPYSYTIQPPVSAHLGEWIVVITARATTNSRITVRLRDLGTHR